MLCIYINKVRERAAKNALETGLSLYTGTVTLDVSWMRRAMELFAEVPRGMIFNEPVSWRKEF